MPTTRCPTFARRLSTRSNRVCLRLTWVAFRDEIKSATSARPCLQCLPGMGRPVPPYFSASLRYPPHVGVATGRKRVHSTGGCDPLPRLHHMPCEAWRAQPVLDRFSYLSDAPAFTTPRRSPGIYWEKSGKRMGKELHKSFDTNELSLTQFAITC